jgi:hypothetical protein
MENKLTTCNDLPIRQYRELWAFGDGGPSLAEIDRFARLFALSLEILATGDAQETGGSICTDMAVEVFDGRMLRRRFEFRACN